MVFLSRIYTRTGDGGTTGLGDGTRVSKTDPRVEAYGSVDELSAAIGLAIAEGRPRGPLLEILRRVQNELLDLGADLCVPVRGGAAAAPAAPGAALRISAAQVERFEAEIDRLNERLSPLRSFVLPGGSPLAAHLHFCRTVCRRAERRAFALASSAAVNPQALVYLNRLSDLLFVMARVANGDGREDLLWEPGKTLAGTGGDPAKSAGGRRSPSAKRNRPLERAGRKPRRRR